MKEVSPQMTISKSKKSGQERLIFSHDSHENNFQFKYAFTPTAREKIKSTNEILRKNQNDMRLYQLIK